MSQKPPSYSSLTHDVVHESTEPISAAEIMARVNDRRPITTKNPKGTIRGAISESHMIVSTGDGRYGWKPRILDGSILRHTLSETEIVEKVLHWDGDLMDALWPTFLAKQMYQDRSPAKVALPNESVSEMALIHYGHTLWGTPAAPTFWLWLLSIQPQAGDHLLFRIIEGEERWFAVTFEARTDRDEAAIAARNAALVALGQKMMQRPYAASEWEVTTHALATGFYQDEVPPDPIGELWDEIAGVLDAEMGYEMPESKSDDLLSSLFERPAQVYDPMNPPDLPPEYNPEWGYRRSRPSAKARRGSVSSWTFRVNHRAVPDAYADIELAEDQTLEDLHLEIQSVFGWDDDHLYSFFVADESRERTVEVGCPWSETIHHTHQVQIGTLGLAPNDVFLYLFDYGDYHEFDVVVLDLNPIAPKGKYPKIHKRPGTNRPQQYPPET